MKRYRNLSYCRPSDRPALALAHNRMTRRAYAHNLAHNLGFLHAAADRCHDNPGPAQIRRIGSVVDIPATGSCAYGSGQLRQWVRIGSALRASGWKAIAGAVYAAGLVHFAGASCRHEHDCCGCYCYFTPRIVARKGRAVLITQNYFRNL